MHSSSFLLRMAGPLLMLLSVAGAHAQYSWSKYQNNPLVTNAVQPCVIYDSAAQHYRMWYIELGTGVIREGMSPDGQTWTIRDGSDLAPGASGTYDTYIHTVTVTHFGDSLAMYYTCSNDNSTLVVARAVSVDGTHWVKSPLHPVLTYGGYGSWDSHAVGVNTVLFRNGVFKMWYGGDNSSIIATGSAQSTDGVTWTKYAGNPILTPGPSGSFDAREAAIIAMDWHDSLAVGLYESVSGVGAETFSIATSADGITWTKSPGNPVYTPSAPAWDGYAIGGGTLLWTNGRYTCWYSGYSGYYWSVGMAFLQRPGALVVTPGALDFGWVRVNTRDTASLTLSHPGGLDTLHVVSITSSDTLFSVAKGPFLVPPGDSLVLPVVYTPKSANADSGSITCVTGSPAPQTVRVSVRGRGFRLSNAPTIVGITTVPNLYAQVRVTWLRSIGDSTGAADPVTMYSIWRLVPGMIAQGSAQRPASLTLPAAVTDNPSWDFVATVPAANLDRYSYIAPVLYNYAQPYTWTTFLVAAHTKGLMVYQSAPDSIQYDPPPLTSVNSPTGDAPREFALDQNYPNPFNPTTVIRYGLPQRSPVKLEVYNMLGQRVATLENGERESGYHEVRFDGTGLASGVYVYRLQAGSFVKSMKLLLLR